GRGSSVAVGDGAREGAAGVCRHRGARDQPGEGAGVYNTLTNNCTTNIVRHVNTISPRRIPFSYKVLLPAYSDSLAIDVGLIESHGSLEEMRALHRIDLVAQRIIGAADFSRLIR